MNPPATAPVLAMADSEGWRTCSPHPREPQAALDHGFHGKPGSAERSPHSDGALRLPGRSGKSVIHIATGSDANEIRDFIQSLPCRIEELEIEVSTGPVVDFRMKSSLSQHLEKKGRALLYPHTIKTGRVIPPLFDASGYGDARVGKKPVAITVNDATRRWLIPASRFVLIKRFSSKE
jgi:hypothetical protein